jgi:hypothetical protein
MLGDMTWNRRHHHKRDAARDRLCVGGLLPMALLAGGFALDADDDAPVADVHAVAA